MRIRRGFVKILKVGGLLVGAFALSAAATDYKVPEDGTLDAVIGKAAKGDTVYVAPGTYRTSAQYGPNILCNLIGTGATRDDVVIESSGSYRTLRLADGGRIENVTIVGEGSYKAEELWSGEKVEFKEEIAAEIGGKDVKVYKIEL
jgi:hypothetical protein